jgi:hypothetical protein
VSILLLKIAAQPHGLALISQRGCRRQRGQDEHYPYDARSIQDRSFLSIPSEHNCIASVLVANGLPGVQL